MKVYFYEVREVATGNLERLGTRPCLAEAVKEVYGCGVLPEQVYNAEPVPGSTLRAYGVGQTRDGVPVVFKILCLEVE